VLVRECDTNEVVEVRANTEEEAIQDALDLGKDPPQDPSWGFGPVMHAEVLHAEEVPDAGDRDDDDLSEADGDQCAWLGEQLQHEVGPELKKMCEDHEGCTPADIYADPIRVAHGIVARRHHRWLREKEEQKHEKVREGRGHRPSRRAMEDGRHWSDSDRAAVPAQLDALHGNRRPRPSATEWRGCAP
jgi:hypothetical protein